MSIHEYKYTYIQTLPHTYILRHVQPANDDVSAMPEHYYNEVEMFLNRQVYSNIYMLIHTYAQTYIYSHIHILIHTYTYTYIYLYIHMLIHTYAHTYMCSYIHTYINSYVVMRTGPFNKSK